MYSAIGGSAAMSASELSAYSLQGHNLCCAKETVDRSVLSLRSPATASGTLARPVAIAIARHSATSSATSCAAHASTPATSMAWISTSSCTDQSGPQKRTSTALECGRACPDNCGPSTCTSTRWLEPHRGRSGGLSVRNPSAKIEPCCPPTKIN